MVKKILIVDDDPCSLEIMTKMLGAAGFEVFTAANGQEGYSAAKKLRPDLIILDVMMPKMDGYEVCRLLKFDKEYSAIPVVFLTSRAQSVDRAIAAKVGADHFVNKPVNRQEMLDMIKGL